MRFHLGLGSKAKRLFLSSPAKEKTVNGENPVGELGFKSKQVVDSGFRYSDFGSKDETFFDTKAWLDSDCEDDFYSVNGDFTPSRGNTPVHHFGTPRTPPMNKSLNVPTFADSKSEPSPTDGKKKLFDLLREALQVETAVDEKNAEARGNGHNLTDNQPLKSCEASPCTSVGSSIWSGEVSPGKENKKERTGRSLKNCCFPMLVHSLSFNYRRKPRTIPAR